MPAAIRLHSLNDVKIVGRLTRDPELRFTTQGTPVCHFRVAVGRKYKDRAGEWREEVAYVPCSVWRESAERCGQRLKKGSPVFIEGRLKSKEWQTKEGQKRSDLELDVNRIQFLEASGEQETSSSPVEDGNNVEESAPVPVGAGNTNFETSENEVPF